MSSRTRKHWVYLTSEEAEQIILDNLRHMSPEELAEVWTELFDERAIEFNEEGIAIEEYKPQPTKSVPLAYWKTAKG